MDRVNVRAPIPTRYTEDTEPGRVWGEALKTATAATSAYDFTRSQTHRWIDRRRNRVQGGCVNYDKDKVDDTVLALLFLTLHDEFRAWKGHDWDAMDRLHEKGMISNPVGKTKSVVLTEEGRRRCEQLFKEYFCRDA